MFFAEIREDFALGEDRKRERKRKRSATVRILFFTFFKINLSWFFVNLIKFLCHLFWGEKITPHFIEKGY